MIDGASVRGGIRGWTRSARDRGRGGRNGGQDYKRGRRRRLISEVELE